MPTNKTKNSDQTSNKKKKLTQITKTNLNGIHNQKNKKRAHTNKELLSYLWQFVKPQRELLWKVGILLLINVLFTIGLPLIFQYVLGEIEGLDATQLSNEVKVIIPWLVAYFSIMFINWISIAFRRKYTIMLNSTIIRDMRKSAFADLMQNNMNFYHNSESGKLVSTITNDIQELSDTGERFIIVVINLIRLVITIAILLWFSWKLTLASVIFLPVFFFIFWALRKYRRKAERSWRKNFGDVNQSFSESMRSIAVCKTFAQEDENIKIFREKNEATYKASIRRALGIFVIGPFSDLFKHVLLVIVLFLGMILLRQPDSTLTVSSFYLFVILIDYYYFPILNLVYNMNRFQALFGVLDRLFNFCKNPLNYEQYDQGEVMTDLNGEVEFVNVNFAYEPEKPVLKDISFHIVPGQRLALVGHTGVGKTTIASLLMRFYSIQSGEILLDGRNILNYDLSNLRQHIGLVNQNVLLIKGTIRDNLLLAKHDATDDEIWAALDAVQAREFIEALPENLDTIVTGNGKNLSAGQRQMISFARVLLGNPKLIILDEATSSVDLYTEARIQYSTDLLLQGRSSIVIAHRLTTILKSDKIVVMENGKIVQIGTHQELIEQKGSYQEMFNLYFQTQSAKYLEQIRV